MLNHNSKKSVDPARPFQGALSPSKSGQARPVHPAKSVRRNDQSGPVFFLHGLMGTCKDHFAPQIREWGPNSRLHALDLPGHGTSGLEARRPYYARAQELLARQLARKGPARVVAVSYLGGTIAINTALKHPDLFQSLVLSGVTYDVPKPVFVAWIEGFAKLASQNTALRDYYNRVHGPRWRSTLATVQEECESDYEAAALLPLERLLALRVPTVILNGALKSNEKAACEALQRASPTLSVYIIPDAGHIAGVDQPDVYIREVQAFWTRTSEAANDL